MPAALVTRIAQVQVQGATCGDGEACPELEFCDDGFTDAWVAATLIAQALARVLPVATVSSAQN